MTMNLHFGLAVVVVTREKNISEISGTLCSIKADRATGFAPQAVEEMLAVEEPPEIQLGYGAVQSRPVKSISITMRTSGNDFSLAAGFLMRESCAT
jgi:formate dehydrogenase assembly factor FdhD